MQAAGLFYRGEGAIWGVMSRPAKLLGADAILSLVVVAWYKGALWIQLYGFAAGLWRTAVEFFHQVVFTGSLLFVMLFLLLSGFLFYFRVPAPAEGPTNIGRSNVQASTGLVYEAFYGDNWALAAKYGAFCLSVLVGPYLYHFFWWQFGGHAATVVSYGLATTIITFGMAALVIRALEQLAKQGSAQ